MDFISERIAAVGPEEAALTGVADGTGIGAIDIIDLHDRYQQLILQASGLLGPCDESEQLGANVDAHRPVLEKMQYDLVVISSAIISVAVQRERLARGTASDQA